MWAIGFLDLKNIEIDTKIIVIGCPSADLLFKKNVFWWRPSLISNFRREFLSQIVQAVKIQLSLSPF